MKQPHVAWAIAFVILLAFAVSKSGILRPKPRKPILEPGVKSGQYAPPGGYDPIEGHERAKQQEWL